MGDVEPDQEVKVFVNVTDTESGVKSATLYYNLNDSETWTAVPMDYNLTSRVYNATIPGQPAGTYVRFKIVAYDHLGNNATLNGTAQYCTYQVIPEFTSTIILSLLMAITTIIMLYAKKREQRKTPDVHQALTTIILA